VERAGAHLRVVYGSAGKERTRWVAASAVQHVDERRGGGRRRPPPPGRRRPPGGANQLQLSGLED
jgi:hypothetical protein